MVLTIPSVQFLGGTISFGRTFGVSAQKWVHFPKFWSACGVFGVFVRIIKYVAHYLEAEPRPSGTWRDLWGPGNFFGPVGGLFGPLGALFGVVEMFLASLQTFWCVCRLLPYLYFLNSERRRINRRISPVLFAYLRSPSVTRPHLRE